MITTSTKLAAWVVAVFLLSVCGCGTNQAKTGATTKTQLPAPNFSFQWSNPQTELDTPDATFVRAFEESRFAVYSSGTVAYAYPGFDHANHGAFDTAQYQRGVHIPNIMSVTNFQLRLGPIETGPDGIVQATVCFNSATDEKATLNTTEQLDYRREGASPPTVMGGPASRPTNDVFAGWYAVGLSYMVSESATAFCDSPDHARWPRVGEPLRPPMPGWPQ